MISKVFIFEVLGKNAFKTALHLAKNHVELAVGFREQPVANQCKQKCSNSEFGEGVLICIKIGLLMSARQLSPILPRTSICGPNFYKGLKKHCSILGHLAPVFCVLFDHTGERIMTVSGH